MSVNLPILYSFRRCPYAMRARLALLASRVAYEHREVDLKNKPAAMLAASPKATVPVLVLPDETVLDESQDIVWWALRQSDPYGWLAHAADAQDVMRRCDGDFKYHLDRYKYPTRYDQCNAAVHRDQAAVFLQTMQAQLSQEAINCHDVNICYEFNSSLGIYYAGYMPFLRQYAHTDKVWFTAQPWPHLQAALASFEASDAFKTVMQTYPHWSHN